MNQSELEGNTCNRRQARENACKQVVIGLSFTSDWSRKWREIFSPITKRSKAKPKQNANYFRHSIENCSSTSSLIVCQPIGGEIPAFCQVLLKLARVHLGTRKRKQRFLSNDIRRGVQCNPNWRCQLLLCSLSISFTITFS